MNESKNSGPGSKPSAELYHGPAITDEALDLIAEIKLKAEDLTQVANLMLLTSKVVSSEIPGTLRKDIRSGSEDLFVICEAQFRVMARELGELLYKTWM